MHFQLEVAPFKLNIQTTIPLVIDNLTKLYPPQLLTSVDDNSLADYDVSIDYSGLVRKYIKPQCSFKFDQFEPFLGLPIGHAYANLEWGMNYVIASNIFNYLIIHSGIVAKNNKAVLFPAPPGSGKSTLTAYLQGQTSWRLLSDEMALIDPETLEAIPFVRPICLKNRSGQLVQQWFPDVAVSTIAGNTHKGDVVHVSPSKFSWEQRKTRAEIKSVVFPRYDPDVELEVYALTKTQAFMQLAENAFNFSLLGVEGFETIIQIIEKVDCYEIVYNDVKEVEKFLDEEVLFES